jgi:hypothetical protein
MEPTCCSRIDHVGFLKTNLKAARITDPGTPNDQAVAAATALSLKDIYKPVANSKLESQLAGPFPAE